jgi:hypothetical protein
MASTGKPSVTTKKSSSGLTAQKIISCIEDFIEVDEETVTEISAALMKLFRSSQSKSSSSSGERKQNPYSIFVSKLSKHSKGEATIDLEILVGNHYTNKDSKSCVVFKEHFTDYEGQTYDFAELFTNGQRQSGRQPAQVLWSHLGHARGR